MGKPRREIIVNLKSGWVLLRICTSFEELNIVVNKMKLHLKSFEEKKSHAVNCYSLKVEFEIQDVTKKQ